jgi:uncharacterized membrane-anchored protein YhcB (DUF1043 family)
MYLALVGIIVGLAVGLVAASLTPGSQLKTTHKDPNRVVTFQQRSH